MFNLQVLTSAAEVTAAQTMASTRLNEYGYRRDALVEQLDSSEASNNNLQAEILGINDLIQGIQRALASGRITAEAANARIAQYQEALARLQAQSADDTTAALLAKYVKIQMLDDAIEVTQTLMNELGVRSTEIGG